MIERYYPSGLVQTIVSLLIPFIQLFGFYAIIHGHYGPGGGFQGGVLLAVSVILHRVCFGGPSRQKFPPLVAPMIAASGMLIFVLAGIIPLCMGASFLDYAALPLPVVCSAELRYLGILFAEVGIGLAVCGTMILIFDTIAIRHGNI